jgi:hypothetical protein
MEAYGKGRGDCRTRSRVERDCVDLRDETPNTLIAWGVPHANGSVAAWWVHRVSRTLSRAKRH